MMSYTKRSEWDFSSGGYNFECYYDSQTDCIEVRCDQLGNKLSAKAGSVPKVLAKVLADQIIKMSHG